MKKSGKKNKKQIGLIAGILGACGFGLLILLYNLGLTQILLVPTLPEEEQIKVACVGDSVTYGYGLSNRESNNYPAVLQQKLGNKYHVLNFGVNGHCVQNSSDKPYTSSENYELSVSCNADIVVFMLGSNDSKVHNWQGKEVFRTAYYELLDDYKDSKIILCTPATAFYIDDNGNVTRGDEEKITTFDIQPEVIEEIASIVRDVSEEKGYPLIEINDLTHKHPEWFTLDGTHPSEDGAKSIAGAVYNKILEIN